jgi:hypothetical protein
MTVYDGCPPPRRRRVTKLSPETLTRCSWGPRTQGCKGTSLSIYIYMLICIFHLYQKGKKEIDRINLGLR